MPLACPFPYPESFLSYLWLETAGRMRELRTESGKRVSILDAGHPTAGIGPDFTGCKIRLDGRLVWGDIEVDRTPSDWRTHGHEMNPRFERVVLRVVWWPAGPFRAHRGPDVVSLFPYWTGRLIPSWKEFQMARSAWSCPARQDIAARPDEVTALVALCGERRFFARVQAFHAQSAATAFPQAFWNGLLTGLGYSVNAKISSSLAERFPLEQLSRVLSHIPTEERLKAATALLLAVADLLPPVGEPPDPMLLSLRQALSLTSEPLPQPLSAESWQHFRVRLANWPERRLAYAAGFACRWGTVLPGWPAMLAAHSPRELIRVLQESLDAVPVLPGFESLAKPGVRLPRPMPILGRGRKITLLANLVLPLLYAWAEAEGPASLRETALEAYRLLPPSEDNHVLRRVSAELFGGRLPAALRTARHEQGLLYLSRLFCSRGNCAGCFLLPYPASSIESTRETVL